MGQTLAGGAFGELVVRRGRSPASVGDRPGPQLGSRRVILGRGGKRYTPYGDSVAFETDTVYFRNGSPNSALGPYWSSLGITWEKHFGLGHTKLSLVIEATNILNHRNITLVNPVTGRGYKAGEPIPTGDNFFETAPAGYNLPIWDDPARYERPIHWQLGLKWNW